MLLAAQLPESIDPDDLRKILLAGLFILGLLIVFVIRTVQKAAWRVFLVLVLLGCGVGLWFQRAELEECQGQCTCHLFWMDVKVPDIGSINCPQ